MAIAPVLKTGIRKGMGVRIPRSPPNITLLTSSHPHPGSIPRQDRLTGVRFPQGPTPIDDRRQLQEPLDQPRPCPLLQDIINFRIQLVPQSSR